MTGEPAVLLLMERIHVYISYALFWCRDLSLGVVTALVFYEGLAAVFNSR